MLPISVLVVEDDLLSLQMLSDLLEESVSEVYRARNGQEALEVFEKHRPDVITSDIHMPNMNGIELLKAIRQRDAKIPFLLITASEDVLELPEAIAYNITLFLLKPLRVDTLLDKLQEIAENKQRDLAIQQTFDLLEQHEHIVDISSIVSKTDLKGRITYANDLFCELSGYTKDELIGQKHNIVRDPAMPASTFADLWQTITAKKIWQGVIHNRKKNGERYSVQSTVAPVLDINGNITEFIAFRQDVTAIEHAKYEAEKASRIKSEFLANMSHEIRTPMNGMLGFTALLNKTELNEQQRQYLDIINGSTAMLMGIINDILDFSKIESGKLSLDLQPVNPFIEFEKTTKLFSAKMHEKDILFRVQIDASIGECLVLDLLRMQQVLSNLINNALKFTPQHGEVTVTLRASRSDAAQQTLHVSVKDNGIGIPKEKQLCIFDSFSQADSSTEREFGGTGLGLSISSSLVAMMGGELQIASEEGQGSEFFFEIPAARCDAADTLSSRVGEHPVVFVTCPKSDMQQVERVREHFKALDISHIRMQPFCAEMKLDRNVLYISFCPEGEELERSAREQKIRLILACSQPSVEDDVPSIVHIPDLKYNFSTLYNAFFRLASPKTLLQHDESSRHTSFRGNILVAEDNPVNQLLIREFLELHGITPDIVDNGQQAYEMASRNTYDLIFMDINMPQTNGMKSLQMIRADKIDTPVIALTANAMIGDREKYIASGFNDYLLKPITLEALHRVLNQYLVPVTQIKKSTFCRRQ